MRSQWGEKNESGEATYKLREALSSTSPIRNSGLGMGFEFGRELGCSPGTAGEGGQALAQR